MTAKSACQARQRPLSIKSVRSWPIQSRPANTFFTGMNYFAGCELIRTYDEVTGVNCIQLLRAFGRSSTRTMSSWTFGRIYCRHASTWVRCWDWIGSCLIEISRHGKLSGRIKRWYRSMLWVRWYVSWLRYVGSDSHLECSRSPVQAFFHGTSAPSEVMGRRLLKLDYVGICFSISVTNVSSTYFGLYDKPWWQAFYNTFCIVSAFAVLVSMLNTNADGPEVTLFRYVWFSYLCVPWVKLRHRNVISLWFKFRLMIEIYRWLLNDTASLPFSRLCSATASRLHTCS